MRQNIVRTSLAAASGVLLLAAPAVAAPGYRIFRVGNRADVVRPTSPLLVLQGGGTDVDENFVRMSARAGGGDFLVIRATGGGAYNQYIYDMCACDSVETIRFMSRESASNPFLVQRIRQAEALFIAGGDQSDYVRYWKDTPVEDAINYLIHEKQVPVGGTSAGMAVLSGFLYSAMTPSSLDSSEALANPFHPDLTLDRDFLDPRGMAGIITDQHFIERDRMGRTVAFLARLVQDGWTAEARAVAADRETSLIVDPVEHTVEVLATPSHPTPYVYFLRTPGPPQVCQPAVPLTFRDLQVYRIGPGGTFDLDDWQGSGGIAYTITAETGVLSSSRGEIY
jgi:cyanophycinase